MAYYIDIEKSQKLAGQGRKFIAKQRCYANIWNLYSRRDYALVDPSWSIAYGVVQVNKTAIYIAHAFFFDHANQKVIDPTLPDSENEKYLIAIKMTQEEYLQVALEYKTTDLKDNEFIWSAFQSFLGSEDNEAEIIFWDGGTYVNTKC